MTWYESVLQILLIGIANGALISLIALGYTMVYGIIELINFAHGDLFMIGTMISLTLVTAVPAMLGLPPPSNLDPPPLVLLLVVGLLISMVGCAGLDATTNPLAY